MGFRWFDGRVVAAVVTLCFMAFAAGCQSGDSAGDVVDPGSGSTTAPEGKILQSELRAYCPKVMLREEDALRNAYEKNAEDDPTKLIYRSSLSTATRKCEYGPGTISMTIAVAGRVIPGPLATDGTVKMPMRVEVKRGDEVLYSNVADYEVAVSKASGATQFIYSDPNVTIPTPQAADVQAYIGYDPGPEKKKKKADDEL
jgi:hypothetical protein